MSVALNSHRLVNFAYPPKSRAMYDAMMSAGGRNNTCCKSHAQQPRIISGR